MKQTLYPKTTRVAPQKFVVTEKLDGSNLGMFKWNQKLYIAQRKNIYLFEEIKELKKDDLYGGLREWLEQYGQALENSLQEGACIFGEWLSMGRLKYQYTNRMFMFAKANIKFDQSNGYEAYNIYYTHELFQYSFINQEIPNFISTVPIVAELDLINIDELNALYDKYSKAVGRNVEGFIVIYNRDSIKKYVRMKSGHIEEHFWRK